MSRHRLSPERGVFPFLRRALRRAAAALGLAGGLSALPAAAGAACAGVDLLERMAVEDPQTHAAILEAAAAEPNGEGLLWRVTGGGGPPSWLFGTFHSADPRIARVPPRAAAALAAARTVYVEITPAENRKLQQRIQADPALILDASGATLDRLLTREQMKLAGEVAARYGVPYETLRRMRPWFLQVLIALPPCALAVMREGGPVLDIVLAERAASAGKAVKSLETWEEALASMSGQSEQDAVEGLLVALSQAADAENFLRTTENLYLQERTMLIWHFGRAAAGEAIDAKTADEAVARFWQTIVVDRSARFLAAAAEGYAQGGVFVAVGALHLGGADGMVEMLRDAGYQVERVPLE